MSIGNNVEKLFKSVIINFVLWELFTCIWWILEYEMLPLYHEAPTMYFLSHLPLISPIHLPWTHPPPTHPLPNFICFSVNKQTNKNPHEPPLPSVLELWLTWSCADYHSCCDSWAGWLTATSCPEDRISHLSFLVSSWNIPWALGQGEVDTDVLSGAGHSWSLVLSPLSP